MLRLLEKGAAHTATMTTSRFPDLPEITDELLSAYIDNAVTESERARIEQALREDSNVAWRLATLRETVQMLQALPVLNAPRAFVLTPEMVGQRHTEPIATAPVVAQNEGSVQYPRRQPASPSIAQPGWWARWVDGWRIFWKGGSPVWRNALATSMAALLVLLALPTLLRSNTVNNLATPAVMSQSGQESVAPASEAIAEIAADAANGAVAATSAAKQGANATAVQTSVATSVAVVAMTAPAEAEVVAASAAVRVIPGERTTEDALSGVASAEDAPAYAAAAGAPAAPEIAAAMPESAAMPEGAMLAAPDIRAASSTAASAMAAPTSSSTNETTDASIAAPAGAATNTPMATTPPTATAMSTMSTAAAVAAGESAARGMATAAAVAPTLPPAANGAPPSILAWLQWAALVGVVTFGFLWWRSRRA